MNANRAWIVALGATLAVSLLGAGAGLADPGGGGHGARSGNGGGNPGRGWGAGGGAASFRSAPAPLGHGGGQWGGARYQPMAGAPARSGGPSSGWQFRGGSPSGWGHSGGTSSGWGRSGGSGWGQSGGGYSSGWGHSGGGSYGSGWGRSPGYHAYPRVRGSWYPNHYRYYRPRTFVHFGIGFGGYYPYDDYYYAPVVVRPVHRIIIADLPPDDCYYYDPYCDQRFSCLDDYVDHLSDVDHEPILEVIDGDGACLSTYGYYRGQWSMMQ